MLTQKQETFCLHYIESGNATEAYRKAGYGPGMSDKTVMEAACRLLKNRKVIARVEEIRAPAVAKAQMTLETHLADLQALRDAASEKAQYSAAISAEIARGKAAGLYVEKSDVKVTTRELPASVDEFV